MTELAQSTPARMPLTRRRIRRARALAAVLVAAALLVAGCTATTQTAAVVDGQDISMSDAQTAAQEINEQFTPQNPLTTSDALNYLIIAPTVLAAAAKAGNPQSADVVRTQFTKVSDPDPAAVTVLQVNNALQGLDQTAQQQLLANIAKLDVSLNPRFGKFDGKTPGIVEATPNWVVATTKPSSTAPATP